MTALVNTMAYVGAKPWHGLGVDMPEDADLNAWRIAAGLDWNAVLTPVLFQPDGTAAPQPMAGQFVLHRSDTRAPLSIVGSRYKPVQPREIIEFYRDLTNHYGYTMETAGVLQDGKKVWALARTGMDARIHGNDALNCYLLLATSYDGTMATTARLTSVRVVCNNTLQLSALTPKAEFTVPHTQRFDAVEAKFNLFAQHDSMWSQFTQVAQKLSERDVSPDEQAAFIRAVYFSIHDESDLAAALEKDRALEAKIERITKRMRNILAESPGAQLPSAKGTAWGLVSAVTYDVDFSTRSRSNDTRLNAAWFGNGSTLKARAFELGTKLLEAA